MSTVSDLQKYTKNLEGTLQTLSGKNASAAEKLDKVQAFNNCESLSLALAAAETYSYSGPSVGPGNSNSGNREGEGK